MRSGQILGSRGTYCDSNFFDPDLYPDEPLCALAGLEMDGSLLHLFKDKRCSIGFSIVYVFFATTLLTGFLIKSPLWLHRLLKVLGNYFLGTFLYIVLVIVLVRKQAEEKEVVFGFSSSSEMISWEGKHEKKMGKYVEALQGSVNLKGRARLWLDLTTL